MKVRQIPDGTYYPKNHTVSFLNESEWNDVTYWAIKKNNELGLEPQAHITPSHLRKLLTETGSGELSTWEGIEEDLKLLEGVDKFEFFNIHLPAHDKIASAFTDDWVPARPFHKGGTKRILENGGYYADFTMAYGWAWENDVKWLGVPTMQKEREYTFTVPKTKQVVTRKIVAFDHGYRLNGKPIYMEPYSNNRNTKAKTLKSYQYGARDILPEAIYKKLTMSCRKAIYKVAIGMLVANMGGGASTQSQVTKYEVVDGKCRATIGYKEKLPRKRFITTRNLLHQVIIQTQRKKMQDIDELYGIEVGNTDGFLTESNLADSDIKKQYPNLKIRKFDKAWIYHENCYLLEVDGKLYHWGDPGFLVREFPELQSRADKITWKFNGTSTLTLNTIEIKPQGREVLARRTSTENRSHWRELCDQIVKEKNITTEVDESVAGSGKTYRLNQMFKDKGVSNIHGYTYNVLNQDQIRKDNPGADITGLIKNQNNMEKGDFKTEREYAAIDEGQDCNYKQLFYILKRIKEGGTLKVFMDQMQAINPMSHRGMMIEPDWFKVRTTSPNSHRLSNQLAEFIRDKYGVEIYGTFDEDFRLSISKLEDVRVEPWQTFVCYHNVTGMTAVRGGKVTFAGRQNYKHTTFKAKGMTLDNCVSFVDFTSPKFDYVCLTRGRHCVNVVFTPKAWKTNWVNPDAIQKWETYMGKKVTKYEDPHAWVEELKAEIAAAGKLDDLPW